MKSEAAFPILPPVQNADHQNAHVIQQIDDHVRLVRVKADGGREFVPFASYARIVCNQVQRRR
jgi:hypothetical protein